MSTGDAGFFGAARDAADVQSPVPLDRWDLDTWYSPEVPPRKMTIYTRFGAFCADIDQFEVRKDLLQVFICYPLR